MLFKAVQSSYHRNKQSVVLQDCQGVPMYTLVVKSIGGRWWVPNDPERYEYKIYDRERTFLARGRYEKAQAYPRQLFFSDTFGAPIAVAESPTIGYSPNLYAKKDHREKPADAIAPWHLAFYGAAATNSTLIHAQNRWVVASAVQDHAWREAAQTATVADFRLGFQVLCAIACFLVALAFDAAVRRVHSAVYPPEQEDDCNPFFRNQQAYGALGPRVWEKKTARADSQRSDSSPQRV